MKSVPYMGPATAFFPLDTRNFRLLVTHDILGMKIEGRSILKNFTLTQLHLEVYSL